jgi:Kef-type K+ transport system membrane component KefB
MVSTSAGSTAPRLLAAIPVIAIVWAVLGFVLAMSALGSVNPDARVVALVLSIVGPLAALVAAVAIRLGRRFTGAIGLLLSVVTPTYFAWAVNLVPIVLAVALLLLTAPHLSPPRRGRPTS